MDKVEFSQPLFFLNLVGLNLLKNDEFSKARRVILVLILFLVFVLAYSELLTNFNNFDTIVHASEVIFPQYQIIWKTVILIIYKKGLAQRIEETTHFWPLNQFGKNVAKSAISVHTLLRKIFMGYAILIYSSASLFIFPAIGSDRPIILTYGENRGFSAETKIFYFIFHTIATFITLTLVTGFDGLFFYFVGHILSELKMLKIAFSDLKIETAWSCSRRLSLSIQHHIYILKYIKDVNNVYSTYLLNQHFSSLFGLCFGLILMTKDGLPPDFNHLFRYLPYIIAFLLQLWMFCYAGTLIITSSLEIPNEIFYHDWNQAAAYENKLSKIIAIKRGQSAAKLTLGGFGNLDLESFNLFKLTLNMGKVEFSEPLKSLNIIGLHPATTDGF
ncbi:7tm 6 domain containing protein [Asbolus verrucosus]|uniref:Odorant receptor n=1 Tax=Asbolus verrucosus TaxID=1661398 RepID=A0A482VGX4_ASBVE|nr:7tm 6 domain containing protein [Asbolus verrucosus]